MHKQHSGNAPLMDYLVGLLVCGLVAIDVLCLSFGASLYPLCFNAYLMCCIGGYLLGLHGIGVVKKASYVGIIALVFRISYGVRFGLFSGSGQKVAAEAMSLCTGSLWFFGTILAVVFHGERQGVAGAS